MEIQQQILEKRNNQKWEMAITKSLQNWNERYMQRSSI